MTVTASPTIHVALRRIDPDLPVPTQARPGDAGVDLCAREDVELPPGGRALVPTGIAVAIPQGYAGFVHPRSGLATRHGVTIVNAPGTIDAGYRGEIKVPLINLDAKTPLRVVRGDRIAQLVIQKIAHADFDIVESLDDSARGAGGFGSTGGIDAGLSEKEK